MSKSNIFFTSDHHFGHANIINLCNRPFKSVEEMNQVMIDRWNEKVRPKDEVYHLGDFAMTKDRGMVNEILNQLHGTIYLIVGNHEGAALNQRSRFQWVKEYYELKVKDNECANGVQRIILLHYAMRVWRGHGRGTWHLYGHSHGSLEEEKDRLTFDIGVDCHNFYPLSYNEVKNIMKAKNWKSPFDDKQ